MNDTFDEVVGVIRDECELDETITLDRDTTFSDLDLDSLSVMQIALACEDRFGITFDLEELPKSLGDFVDIVQDLLDA